MSEPIPVRVECYAGHRADERPTEFFLWGRSLKVIEIIDQWYGEDYQYFKLKADDGSIYILRQDTSNDVWELTVYSRKPGD